MRRVPAFGLLVLLLLAALTCSPTHAATADAGPFRAAEGLEPRLATQDIQKLIDRVAAEGGGVVNFPAGSYLTGSLRLRSHVGLYLERGAVVYGSTDLGDYGDRPSLIYAKGETDISIEGPGTLNGQGEAFWRGKTRPYKRPERFILFNDCRNINLGGVRIEDSPHWTIETRFCDGVWIDGVTIINDVDSPNTDGIDPVSSRNVFISNCYIKTGDDAICPKSLSPTPCENIVVTNCVLESDDSAIKLGTRSEAPIRHVVVSNCVIRNTTYGIAFFAKDGGAFEHLRFSNITIETTTTDNAREDRAPDTFALFVDLERRRPQDKLGSISDVHFDGITIDTRGGQCAFFGQPDSPLRNLRLSDISFTLRDRRSNKGNRKPRGVRHLKDLAANDFTSAPSSFVFAHVDGLAIDRLHVSDLGKSPEHGRHAVWVKDANQVRLGEITHQVAAPDASLAPIELQDTSLVAPVAVGRSTPPAKLSLAEPRKLQNGVDQ